MTNTLCDADGLLSVLPRVFALSDCKQHCADPDQLDRMLLTLLDDGQLLQVAPPRPVFVRPPEHGRWDEPLLCEAIKRSFPSAIIAGGSAIYRQGASAEKDAFLECCVLETHGDCALPGVKIHRRPARWWQALHDAKGVTHKHDSLPVLTAAMAIADGTVFKDVWMPDQQRVDWDHVPAESLQQSREALLELH